MSEIPAWAGTLQALATPVLGLGVALIALMQWRTANQKIVLDVFEKRLAVYAKIKIAVDQVSSSGKVSEASEKLLGEAMNSAEFLFGQDIQVYLADMWFMFVTNKSTDRADGPDAIEKHSKFSRAISAFYTEGPERFAPYMRMDQKLVPTLGQFVRERNRLRLSFADQRKRDDAD